MSNRSVNDNLKRPIAFSASSSDEATTARQAVRVRKDSGVFSRLPDDAQRALRELSLTLVGQMNLKDAQRALRTSMSQEALARCSGSRRAAASLLGVDRRYVQRLADGGGPYDPDEITQA